jgi:hypothetical protein
MEEGLLAALKEDGVGLLEQLIHESSPSAPGPALEPGERNYGLRSVTVLTVLGTILLRRPYYYNETLGRGRHPLDQALGLTGGYSPCVARMMCRAGALSPSFEAAEFGIPVRQEAFRRGMAAARTVVFLGDGAKWVWELARVNFHGAVCILDFYHATEHVSKLIHLLYGEGSGKSKKLFPRWRKALRRNRIGWLIRLATRDLPLAHPDNKDAVREQIAYLENNRPRMQYKTFLEAGYFIGSGVVEAGCKSLVGQRLKQSGMRWSVQGARDILNIRCALASHLFDTLWDRLQPLPPNFVMAPTPKPQLCLN